MISLGKLLVLAVVAGGVYMVVRGFGRRTDAPSPLSKATASVPETLERCPVCGIFHVQGEGTPCDRTDCPTRQKS